MPKTCLHHRAVLVVVRGVVLHQQIGGGGGNRGRFSAGAIIVAWHSLSVAPPLSPGRPYTREAGEKSIIALIFFYVSKYRYGTLGIR